MMMLNVGKWSVLEQDGVCVIEYKILWYDIDMDGLGLGLGWGYICIWYGLKDGGSCGVHYVLRFLWFLSGSFGDYGDFGDCF